MEKRRANIKSLIEKEHITTLREILEYYQITPLVKHLKSSHQRLTKYFNDASLFRFREIAAIGEYFDVDTALMCRLVLQQMKIDARRKSSLPTKKKSPAKKETK